MAADKLTVLIDADTSRQHGDTVAVMDDLTVRAGEPQAITSGIWIEPYSGSAMLLPKQFNTDFYLDSSVPRYGKAAWTLTDAHWDEVAREYDRFLLSDGDDEQIYTTHVFEVNSGFVLDFQLFGPNNDRFLGLQLEFGQWKLDIYSDGKAALKDSDGNLMCVGWLVDRHGDNLCDNLSQLVIMPTANHCLYVRRNGVAGFVWQIDGLDETDPEIIESGKFYLTAPGGMVQFQLTELAFDMSADAYFISPNRQLPKPPPVDTEIDVTAEFENLGGGCVTQIYEGLTVGQGYADLVPFVADGIKDTYCICADLSTNSDGRLSPFFRGARVQIDPTEGAAAENPNTIDEDVSECTIDVGVNAWDTTVSLKIRNPEDHELLGLCNRRAVLKVGDVVIFDGLLAEPPRLTEDTKNAPTFEVTINSLGAKMADQPCLHSNVRFDNTSHVAAIRWLCLYCGIPETLMDFDVDTWLLRNTVTGLSSEKSQLQPQAADTPKEWIDRICEETQWVFLDGPITSGDFGYRYQDPLGWDETPIHTFFYRTVDSAGESAYDLIRSSLSLWSVEPEGNEIHILAGNLKGELCDCIYEDTDSQDPAADPKPDNWLGFRKIVTIPLQGVMPEDLLKKLTLRIGRELSRRVDMVEFEADWKPGLWRGSVVTLDDAEQGYNGAGTYRIESMNLKFLGESPDYPARRATYTATKLETTLAARARATGDKLLAKQVGYYLRYGAAARGVNSTAVPGLPGQQDAAGNLNFSGPIKKVIRVVDEETVPGETLEEFVPGANGMDETTIVK